jgi:hypothetical protein
MPTYASADQWNEKTQKAKATLNKAKAKHAEMENPFYGTGERVHSKKDVADEEYARNKLLNSNEEEQAVQKQRIIDEYPKGTVDEDGRKSRNKEGYGKEPKFAKGGSVGSASKRADGCCVRGKTKGRFV